MSYAVETAMSLSYQFVTSLVSSNLWDSVATSIKTIAGVKSFDFSNRNDPLSTYDDLQRKLSITKKHSR